MNPRMLLFIVLYIIPLSGVGTDLYAPSLPAITQYFHATPTLAKLSMTTFLFGFALGQIIFGTLSDIYGRKPILLMSIAIFTLASILAPFTPYISILLVLRFFQGISAAGPSAIGKSLLSDTLTGTSLRKASIYLAGAWSLGPVLAPAVGGYLQHYYGWQSSFYFFAMYGLSMLMLASAFLKETNTHKVAPQWHTVIHNYRRVFSNRTFVCSVICMGVGYSVFIIFNIVAPFLIQNDLGYSAVVFGHMALYIGAALFMGMMFSRVLVNFISPFGLVKIGMLGSLLTAIVALYIAYTLPMSLLDIVLPIGIIIFFLGMVNPNLMSTCLALFPNIGGTAAAAMGFTLVLIATTTSGIASLLHAPNQIPMVWLYILLTALNGIIYLLFLSQKRRFNKPLTPRHPAA